MSPVLCLLRKQRPECLDSFSELVSCLQLWGFELMILDAPRPSNLGTMPYFLQVIGALPWVVNSASVATPAPAQSLQVQAVTPQLLLNAQGQVIATLASSPLPQPMAVRKPNTPESPAKSEVPGLGVWMGTGRQYCVAWLLPSETSGRTRRLSKVRTPPAEGLYKFTYTPPREQLPFSGRYIPQHVSVPRRSESMGNE